MALPDDKRWQLAGCFLEIGGLPGRILKLWIAPGKARLDICGDARRR